MSSEEDLRLLRVATTYIHGPADALHTKCAYDVVPPAPPRSSTVSPFSSPLSSPTSIRTAHRFRSPSLTDYGTPSYILVHPSCHRNLVTVCHLRTRVHPASFTRTPADHRYKGSDSPLIHRSSLHHITRWSSAGHRTSVHRSPRHHALHRYPAFDDVTYPSCPAVDPALCYDSHKTTNTARRLAVLNQSILQTSWSRQCC